MALFAGISGDARFADIPAGGLAPLAGRGRNVAGQVAMKHHSRCKATLRRRNQESDVGPMGQRNPTGRGVSTLCARGSGPVVGVRLRRRFRGGVGGDPSRHRIQIGRSHRAEFGRGLTGLDLRLGARRRFNARGRGGRARGRTGSTTRTLSPKCARNAET